MLKKIIIIIFATICDTIKMNVYISYWDNEEIVYRRNRIPVKSKRSNKDSQ